MNGLALCPIRAARVVAVCFLVVFILTGCERVTPHGTIQHTTKNCIHFLADNGELFEIDRRDHSMLTHLGGGDGVTGILDATIIQMATAQCSAKGLTGTVGVRNFTPDVYVSKGWTEILPQPPFDKLTIDHMVSFNGHMWLFGNMGSEIWGSSDGKTWNVKVQKTPWTARYGYSVIEYDGRLWFLHGHVNQSHLFDMWSSTDGVNWVKVASHAPWTARQAKFYVYQNKLWMVDVAGHTPRLWSTTDVKNWTKEAISIPNYDQGLARVWHTVTVFKGNILIFGGENNHDVKKNDILSSSDGHNFVVAAKAAPWQPQKDMTVEIFNNRLWMFAGIGEPYVQLNHVWSTSDGINWQVETSNTPWKKTFRYAHTAIFKNQIYVVRPAWFHPPAEIWVGP